ncbi:MAG: hypothetical protein V3V39_11230 [Desulfobacterales bacterium]
MRTDNILFNFHANLIGRFKPGALHEITRLYDHNITRSHGYTVTPAPIKALACLCFFPPMAEKSKPPALRVVGDSRQLVFSERIVACQYFDLLNSRMFA